MAFNPFIGKDQTWLEEKLEALQEELAENSQVTQASGGDASTTIAKHRKLELAIEQVLASLYLLDPVTYPANQVFRTRRTMPRYVWGS